MNAIMLTLLIVLKKFRHETKSFSIIKENLQHKDCKWNFARTVIKFQVSCSYHIIFCTAILKLDLNGCTLFITEICNSLEFINLLRLWDTKNLNEYAIEYIFILMYES